MTEIEQLSSDLAAMGMDWQIPMAGKRPGIRGLGYPGTDDASELLEHFETSHIDGVAVSMLPNGLLGYDIDPGDCTPEQWAKASDWIDEHLQPLIEAGAWQQQSMRDDGYHVVVSHPGEKVYVPGQIMPGVTMRNRNYIRVYDTSGFKTSIEDLPVPPAAAYTQVEGMSGRSAGSGVAEWSDAVKVLSKDGKGGSRHEAVNSLALHIMRQNPDLELEAACREITALIEDVMPAGERRDELCKIAFEPDSEVVRCFRPLMPGGQKRHFVGNEENAQSRLEQALLARAGSIKPIVDIATSKQESRRKIPSDFSIFRRYDSERMLELEPWVVKNILRRGDIGAVVGVPNVGKTNVSALWVACLICGDGKNAGLEIPEAINVAWLNPEEDVDALDLRIRATLAEHGMTPQCEVFTAGSEQLLTVEYDAASLVVPTEDGRVAVNEELVEKYIDELVAAGVKFLMLDPITEFNGGNENSRDDTRLLFRAMMRIGQEAGLTVLYWGHTGKPPEGKREDWYKGDLYAQRGSSGAIGSLKMGATLTPVFPPDTNVKESVAYRNAATSGEAPNVLELVVRKAKMGQTKPHIYYEIKASEMDKDVPVAHLSDRSAVDSYGATKLAEASNSTAYAWATALAAAFPPGAQYDVTMLQLGDVLNREKPTGWREVKTLKPSEGQGKTLIDLLHGGVAVEGGSVSVLRDEKTKKMVVKWT